MYDEVLLLSMMNCFQCAVTSMSKEYKIHNLTTLEASIFSYESLSSIEIWQNCSIMGLVPPTKL